MNRPSIQEQEQLFRFLARENRTRRRYLAESFIGFIEKVPREFRGTRVILPSFPGDPHYLFLLLPRLPGMSDEKYRETRRNLLESYLVILKLHFPKAVNIIGLATETKFSHGESEDFLVIDASAWTEKDNEEAKKVEMEMKQNGLLATRTMFEGAVEEYPSMNQELTAVRMTGSNRNMTCPCGSGKKFKKCCGKLL